MAMEPLLGLTSSVTSSVTSSSYKVVPWISWDEWERVRVSIFSLSPNSALQTVAAWRSRGCLPLVVEITASIVEIQQKDPFFSGNKDTTESEDILAMLYCMTVMRLVNGVIEKTRKKTEVSIGEAADTINIPRVLIDIRHECSHRDLPSLRLVRLASVKALAWLKSYYWEPQKEAIQCPSDGASKTRKEINSRLCELAFSFKMKQAGSSSPIKGNGSRKQIRKAMKILLRIYSSYSLEVVSVVEELLLKESASSDSLCLDNDGANNSQNALDYWKPVITKLSNKEPEFLLTLINTVHERIETEEAMTCRSGELSLSENASQEKHINKLSHLFAWLITILKGVKDVHKEESQFPAVKESFPADTKLPKSTLVELLRKSLVVSRLGNNQLKYSTLVLANMVGNKALAKKLNKLFLLSASNPEFDDKDLPSISSENFFSQQEESINQAAKKLSLLKHKKTKSKATVRAAETNDQRRWVVVKEWNKCPIGMLPLPAASSGFLPVLDWKEDDNQLQESSENNEQGSLVERNLKRKPDCGLEVSGKKPRENRTNIRNDEKDQTCSLDVQGKLMIGGVWKRVDEQDLFAMSANIRILV